MTDYATRYGFDVDADELEERLDTEGINPEGFDVFVSEIAGRGYFPDLDAAVSAYADAVIGEISVTEYAWQYAEDCMGLTGFARDYFDADKFARDLVLGGDVTEGSGGWLFYSSW